MPNLLAALREKVGKHEIVNWYISCDGKYYVKYVGKNDKGLTDTIAWDFENTPMDESVSIFWYQRVIELLKHKDSHKQEVMKILNDTKAREIKSMCFEANRTILNML